MGPRTVVPGTFGARSGAFPAGGLVGNDERGQKGSRCNQTEPLMSLEHVRPFVQPRLILSAALGLIGSEIEVTQRRRNGIPRRSRQGQVYRLPCPRS